MRNPARVAALLLALPGMAALFLPFVASVSPLDTIRDLLRWGVIREYALLGAPFFLAIPIAIWQARRLFASRFSCLEIAGAYALSTAAVISVLWFVALALVQHGLETFRHIEAISLIGACSILLVTNAALLGRCHTKQVTPETAAEVFLLSGYLPNAVFCLIGFGWERWSRLEIGAWIAAVACIAYVVTIAQALRSEDAQPSLATARSIRRPANGAR